MAVTKIYMKPGPDGGDVLYIDSGGTLNIPALSAIVVDDVALTVTATEIEKLAGSGAVIASGTQADNIVDIADDASGALIATAVNSILDALEAFGIMAAAE